jgi:hypothetical protein
MDVMLETFLAGAFRSAPQKGHLQDPFGFASAARATYFGHVRMARSLSSVVRRSAAAGLFLLRAMVAIATVSRHPPSHFVESAASFLGPETADPILNRANWRVRRDAAINRVEGKC